MPYRLKINRKEADDISSTAAWIAERSPGGARSWLAALDKALDALSESPAGYPVADEDGDIPEISLRQFLFKTRRGRVYRGVFTISGDEVRVLRIRSSGQRPMMSDDL